jgi:microcin C transport system substrate-binding protein
VGDDGIRINGDGVQLTLDVMNDSASFERIIQPYIENLKRLGVAASSTRVDPAEAQERQKTFDYDMVVQRYAMSSTPGNELKGIFGSDTADIAGSSNLAGLAHPAVDALIRHIADAESRADLTTAVTALDRVLRALHIWVPQWYKPVHNIAYFDIFERPYTDTPPPYAMGEMSIWWYNAEKAQALTDVGAF